MTYIVIAIGIVLFCIVPEFVITVAIIAFILWILRFIWLPLLIIFLIFLSIVGFIIAIKVIFYVFEFLSRIFSPISTHIRKWIDSKKQILIIKRQKKEEVVIPEVLYQPSKKRISKTEFDYYKKL